MNEITRTFGPWAAASVFAALLPFAVWGCAAAKSAPASVYMLPDPTETPRMKKWINYRYGMFIHFNINTYCAGEHIVVPPAATVYKPTELDVDGWVKLAKDAGMKYAVLTTKHDGGFCLWDSKVQWHGREFEYDVAASGNKTDVVQAFMDACKKYDIAPGFYYCMMDTYANKSAPLKHLFRKGVMPDDAFELAKAQLMELAIRYPDCHYYWLDCPKTATIQQQAVLYDLLRRKDPENVLLMNHHLAHAANGEQTVMEAGYEADKYPAWPVDVLNTESWQRPKGKVSRIQQWQGKPLFMGYEHCDTAGNSWFVPKKSRSVNDLIKLYRTIRQAGGNLLLDVGPTPAGTIASEYRPLLLRLKAQIDAYEKSLMEKKPRATGAAPTGRGGSVADGRLTVSVSALADNLDYIGPAIKENDYTVWGASPVVDDAGKVHLFAARWPEANVDPAWRKSSEIAHYVADRPEGPFKFVNVVARGSAIEGAWDRYAPHNPEIKRFGDTYVLVYIANNDFRQPPHPLNQKIGMMTAPSLDGPWTKVGLILDNAKGHFSEGRQVVNPAIIQVGDKFHLYYKTATLQAGNWRTVYGLAVAETLQGPYRHLPQPITVKGVVIEDASVFKWNEKICLLTTDNHGLVTGLEGGLALWVSDDGIHFKRDWIQLGMRLFPDYLPGYDPAKVKRVRGNRPKAERPKVLVIAGKPAYLYVASGWIYDGSPRCQNHVFKITLPAEAGPVTEVKHAEGTSR